MQPGRVPLPQPAPRFLYNERARDRPPPSGGRKVEVSKTGHGVPAVITTVANLFSRHLARLSKSWRRPHSS